MRENSSNYEAYNELDELLAKANNAGRIGEMEESVQLYQKGLILAKQLKDEIRIKQLSVLMLLSL